MKKEFLLSIVFLFAVVYTTAQKSVALHSNGTTTIFGGDTPLVDAYEASITGDTLYVSGGNFTMPGTIDKGLVIIGAGYHPESTAATQKTYITNTSNIFLGDNASNLYMEGMELYSGLSKSSGVITDFTLIRCKINGVIGFSGSGDPTNATIVQCDIGGTIQLQGVTYSLISNCILRGRLDYSNNNIVKNNIFLYVNSSNAPTYSCNSNTFYNNIFTTVYGPIYSDQGSNNNFQYNIFTGTTPTFGTTPTVLNNYISVDLGTVYVNASEGDYHLLGDASTTYLGDDGAEVGLYGGLVPFKEGAVPINPHISQKSIQTTTDSNGLLNISFTVEAQQN
ncbi:MAG TPA: hypothetical protein VIS27_07895 [Yeosuana sp.]